MVIFIITVKPLDLVTSCPLQTIKLILDFSPLLFKGCGDTEKQFDVNG